MKCSIIQTMKGLPCLVLLLINQIGLAQKSSPLNIYNCAVSGTHNRIEPGGVYDVFVNFINNSNEPIYNIEVELQLSEGATLLTQPATRNINEIQSKYTYGENYRISISPNIKENEVYLDFFQKTESSHRPIKRVVLSISDRVGAANITNIPDNIATKNIKSVVSPKRQYADTVILYVVTATKLNVRKQATANAAVIGTLQMGDTVEVQTEEGGWSKITYRGNSAWVSSRYLQRKMVVKQNIIEEERIDTASVVSSVQHDDKLDIPMQRRTTPSMFWGRKVKWSYYILGNIGLSTLRLPEYQQSPNPNFSFSVGGGISAKYNWYMADVQLYYQLQGCAEFPLSYFRLALYPIGYVVSLQNVNLFAQLGLSVGISPSELDVYDNNTYTYRVYDVGFDVSLCVRLGVQKDSYGAGLYVQPGFTDVSSAPITMYNIGYGIFLQYHF